MLEKIHIYISIIAALVVTVVCIIESSSLFVLASRLVFFIIVFFIIGLIVKLYLQYVVFAKKDEELEQEPHSDNHIEEDSFFTDDESFTQ